jgi:protein TonB
MNNQQGSGNQEKIMLQKARTNVPIRGRHINDVLQKMKKKTDKDRQNRNPKNDKSKTNMVQKVIVTNYNLEKDVVDLIQQNNSFSFGVINPFANNKDYNSEVIDSLEARIAKEKEDLAKKQKIVTITSAVSTKKDYLASYMYKWVSRVEKIGNSYYPQFVRQFGLEGRLIMMVTVNTDGSVDYVKILKSSNSRILDDAAIQIVRMATPFDPMSKEMSQKVYKLQIIRTWVFNKNTLNTTSAKKQPDEKKKERAKF